jgi:hypothetical protein
LAIAATVGASSLHVACCVRSTFDWSLYVPVAVICVVVPTASDAAVDVTAIDTSVALPDGASCAASADGASVGARKRRRLGSCHRPGATRCSAATNAFAK